MTRQLDAAFLVLLAAILLSNRHATAAKVPEHITVPDLIAPSKLELVAIV